MADPVPAEPLADEGSAEVLQRDWLVDDGREAPATNLSEPPALPSAKMSCMDRIPRTARTPGAAQRLQGESRGRQADPCPVPPACPGVAISLQSRDRRRPGGGRLVEQRGRQAGGRHA